MKKTIFGILLSILCIASLVACSSTAKNVDDQLIDASASLNTKPTGKYNEGVVLVKTSNFSNDLLCDLEYLDVEQLYNGSKWYKVTLPTGVDTEEAVSYLIGQNKFDKVDYDYLMGSDGDVVDISSNPLATEQTYLDTQKIKDGWDYITGRGKFAGGSSDVVVAVIDTGVDYNHIDLRNNIWTNSAEIPNNGIDDDNNGYVDDYYGWDCVGNDKDPMDDNGHGTHVAGIIAAENNNFGTVGIAYKCKVMCVKAGNSSGYFTNSDIAEAIQYAYMNGASVINMSFGGSSISTAVEDALEDAYNTCVLVAAAGNDALCNNHNHSAVHAVGASYPAALSYVIGVMSTNTTGTVVSSFSNYDDTPFDKVEYEVYACGEQIPSTWPNNKIARLSGTSMACPVVSGIAALLRSTYTDRDVYSTKYIQSQIVNTGTLNPFNTLLKNVDYKHSVADVYEALTYIPKPSVSLYDYYIFDNVEFGPNNDGDGVIDSGETIHLAVELKNRGGVASNVIVTIDTIRNNDPSLTDPYFNIINNSISLSDIGTYSIRNCGKLYDNGVLIGTEKYFEIVVSESCPNDYLSNFNIHFSYRNGLDVNDNTLYKNNGDNKAILSVSNGYTLPSVISEDTVFEADKLYIVTDNVTIPKNVTVTFKEGCNIQFYASKKTYYANGLYNSPVFYVYGSLYLNGSSDHHISVNPSEIYSSFCCQFTSKGNISFNYVDIVNLSTSINTVPYSNYGNFYINNSRLLQNLNADCEACKMVNGKAEYYGGSMGAFNQISNSYIELLGYAAKFYCKDVESSFIKVTTNNSVYFDANDFKNNIVLSDRIVNQQYNYGRGAGRFHGDVTNNVFLSLTENDINYCSSFYFSEAQSVGNNYFSSAYRSLVNDVFPDYIDSNGNTVVDVYSDCSDYSLIYPFIKTVELFDSNDNQVNSVGREEFKLRITFSREMDTNFNPTVLFGTRVPYSDYKISGAFVNNLVWEGNYTIKAFIENGMQYFNIKNAYSNESDSLKPLVNNAASFSFNIDTTAALSMDLNAVAGSNGIELTWKQDDYDTLMGYNVYRSTSKDGNYVKLNSSVIPENENTFIDENAEPGVNYWYTFTVVFSDLTESNPAGKVSCTALDTIKPTIYHTPVNQGYTNNNLVISCTASDNIGVTSVVLYYRTIGATSFTSINMSKQSNKYSVMIFGSDLTIAGIEYYIVASDGINEISKGSADNTYKVIIKDSSTIAILGDVDGDGQITTKDALMIMQAINGDLILTDDQFKKADLNKDGNLSSVEALRILQYINGNVTTLQM